MTSTFIAGPKKTTFINFVVTAPSRTIDIPVLIARIQSKGEINILSVQELVDVIRKKSDEHKAKIAHLNIYAHASPSVIALGEDRVTLDNFDSYAESLRKISDLFVPRVSFVHFASCKLGQNARLLSKFSMVWNGATVRGFTENQRAEDEWPVGSGPHVTCELKMCK